MNILFDEVIKLSNWIKAYRNIQDKKYHNFKDRLKNRSIKEAMIIFNKQINLIKAGEYDPETVRIVSIPKDNFKVRKIGISCDVDKVLQRVISDVLIDKFDKTLNDSSFAFRKHRNIKSVTNILSNNLINSNIVLKYDIKSFFDEINHDILISKLVDLKIDSKFIELIKSFLTVSKNENGIVTTNQCGIVQGSPIANILSNIYMNDFDSYVESLIKKHYYADITYIRYADDIVIALNNYKLIGEIKQSIEDYLYNELRLSINKDKSKTILFNEDSFEFVGLIFKKEINRHSGKKSISITADITKLRDRLNTSLELSIMSKYSMKRNYYKFKGFITYYYKMLKYDSFVQLIESISDIQHKLELQEKLVTHSTVRIFSRLIKQLTVQSFINSYVDETYSDSGFLASITDKNCFIFSVNMYDSKFKDFGITKPTFLTNLQSKIISMINELSKKKNGSISYQKKRKKIISYQQVYFDVCDNIFKDGDVTEMANRSKNIDVNAMNNEDVSAFYPVY